ncbi:hypothetical protein ARALYDRAFT_915713 [Arabidopsis lyrata subsp. lyrata]|uniref:PRONE domain-containing protein n=1 Tax=Arabidopsis lyrata subsp. lyrata TaxID=81972 RepID=D7MHW4_ARALL|nr:hypothetical protein ARALYDRAFT_915713 [Arabidopsis lyrata subsp. lyrata]
METRPRSDLYANLSALKKLDVMLIDILVAFSDTEFWYTNRGIVLGECEKDSYNSRAPPNGLSEEARKKLQQCRDFANQILKAALAINSGVLAETEIPDPYLETLPKVCLDLSSKHQTLEIANQIEATVHVWRQKNGRRHKKKAKLKLSVGDTIQVSHRKFDGTINNI